MEKVRNVVGQFLWYPNQGSSQEKITEPLHAQPKPNPWKDFSHKGENISCYILPSFSWSRQAVPDALPIPTRRLSLASICSEVPRLQPVCQKPFKLWFFCWSPEHIRQDVLPTPSHIINCPWSHVKGGTRDCYRVKNEGEASQANARLVHWQGKQIIVFKYFPKSMWPPSEQGS